MSAERKTPCAAATLAPEGPAIPLDNFAARVIAGHLVACVTVFLLMMAAGLLMRANQAQALDVGIDRFYQLMTVHGIGTVGVAGLSGSMICWYFLRRHVHLNNTILLTNLVFFLTGTTMILGAVFVGNFAGGWNFLYPLPAMSQGVWGQTAAATFLLGLLLIGVGFLIFYLDLARAILNRYGSLPRALGWPQLFSRSTEGAPPVTVVAATMVFTMNIPGIVVGATILVLNLVNLFYPAIQVDSLLAKNLTYFFGHVFMNGTIYQCVIAVFEILPLYTGRPWKVSHWYLGGWTMSGLMVVMVYPQHLLMDFAMPPWALIIGQTVSWAHGLPVLLISVFGTLTNVHRSGIRWNTGSGLLFFAMLGWAAGVFPGVADGTIVVNQVMHNTQWVPGHFHVYFLLSLVSMLFGFGYHVLIHANHRPEGILDRLAFWGFAVGGFGFVTAFLMGGQAGVPRRYAVHLPEWLHYDQVGAICAAMVVAAVTLFVARFLANVNRGLAR
ncbi:MAG: cbb3-type cytochrome c oxidase subunit I [Bacteroidota bacterium]